MLKKTIKYTDYNGIEREEDFFFNLSKAEIMDMQMGTAGGLAELIKTLVKTQNMPEIIRIFKEIILKSYGEKSADGKRFIKKDENGKPLSQAFSETEAFSNLYMELATDSTEAAKFVNGIIPADMEISEEQQAETMKELFGDTPETKEVVKAELVEPKN
jgi:hypothetical protein